ncbi:hypothetical protein B0T17DRAFT_648472 [Bombardia bombarda]|uniref:Uncharacterized protein n=1 Tax=Bombardia bombarda TaxID=252184 RepID=A0AA39U727_9PEZI|nr:hypothetical protein B0T17DRAFT_648472 [Bombardia bombarda]
MLIGLQVIDSYPSQILELVLPQGAIILDTSDLNGCISTRQTGWEFEIEQSEPRVCQANEIRGSSKSPSPRLHPANLLRDACPGITTLEPSLRADFVLRNSPVFTESLDLIDTRLEAFQSLREVRVDVKLSDWDSDEESDDGTEDPEGGEQEYPRDDRWKIHRDSLTRQLCNRGWAVNITKVPRVKEVWISPNDMFEFDNEDDYNDYMTEWDRLEREREDEESVEYCWQRQLEGYQRAMRTTEALHNREVKIIIFNPDCEWCGRIAKDDQTRQLASKVVTPSRKAELPEDITSSIRTAPVWSISEHNKLVKDCLRRSSVTEFVGIVHIAKHLRQWDVYAEVMRTCGRFQDEGTIGIREDLAYSLNWLRILETALQGQQAGVETPETAQGTAKKRTAVKGGA